MLDMKPYIDENNLKDAVGLNYTQNDVDGHIYTVHDQLEAVDSGIIQKYLSRQVSLQKKRLKTGKFWSSYG